MKNKACTLAILATASAFLSSPFEAYAGAADLETSTGDTMKMEYRGKDKLRVNITSGDGEGYMLHTGGKSYFVGGEPGQEVVMDMASMASMAGNMGQQSAPPAMAGKVLSFEKTGRSEKIAGIKGDIYKVRYIDHEGKERDIELTLSGDPRVLEFRDAMLGMAQSMAKFSSAGQDTTGDMEKELGKRGLGPLRFGSDMKVTAISDRKIDNARFELPAEPMDMSALPGMGTGGNASGEGEGGGIFSSIFGQKSQRQQDRVEDKTEDAADRETDEATDSVVDKALDKLFGR